MFEAIIQWDADVLMYFQENIRTDWLDPIMKGISILGHKGIFPILLCLILLILKDTRRVGIVASMALLFSFLFNNLLLKNLVGRIRPYEAIDELDRLMPAEIDASFPSGHTACAVAIGVALLLAAKNKLPGILMLVFSVLMGVSRLYVGAHYPTDVIVAFFTAGGMAVLAYCLFLFLEKKYYARKKVKTIEAGAGPGESPGEQPEITDQN